MEGRGDVSGWQAGKTLAECLTYSYEHQLFTDVSFEVDQTDGQVKKTLSAHKSILASRSPVFEAMLYGGLGISSSQKISITDVDSESFHEFLRLANCKITILVF